MAKAEVEETHINTEMNKQTRSVNGELDEFIIFRENVNSVQWLKSNYFEAHMPKFVFNTFSALKI